MALEIVRLLKGCTTTQNSAFCLVCGFENQEPVCYRVEKVEHIAETHCRRTLLTEVQMIGAPELARRACRTSQDMIDRGSDTLDALKAGIESVMPHELLAAPVETCAFSAANN